MSSYGWVIVDGVLKFTGMTISAGTLLLADGTAAAPSLAFASAPTNGLYYWGSNAIGLTTNGALKVLFNTNGRIAIRSDGDFAWSSTTDPAATADVILVRDAAATLALRNSSTAQQFRVYNGATSWMGIGGTGNILATSANQNMFMGAGTAGTATPGWYFDGTNQNLVDNGGTHTINAGGAITGQSLLSNTDVRVGSSGFLFFNGSTSMVAPSDGIFQIYNNAHTGFTRLILGTNDATNNGVAIKLSAGSLSIVRGDDSAAAALITGAITTASGSSIIATAANISAGNSLQSGGSQFVVSTKIITYDNINTAGEGVPVIAATANISAQTSNATITSYANPAADADFIIDAQMSVTASTTLVTTLTCTYTDVANVARTMVLPVTPLTGTFATAGAITGAGASIWESASMHIRVKASTTITILTSAGTFTGVTYSASGTIRKLS